MPGKGWESRLERREGCSDWRARVGESRHSAGPGTRERCPGLRRRHSYPRSLPSRRERTSGSRGRQRRPYGGWKKRWSRHSYRQSGKRVRLPALPQQTPKIASSSGAAQRIRFASFALCSSRYEDDLPCQATAWHSKQCSSTRSGSGAAGSAGRKCARPGVSSRVTVGAARSRAARATGICTTTTSSFARGAAPTMRATGSRCAPGITCGASTGEDPAFELQEQPPDTSDSSSACVPDRFPLRSTARARPTLRCGNGSAGASRLRRSSRRAARPDP